MKPQPGNMAECNKGDATVLPRVSVVLPVRNGGAYVALAVESILSQTFRAFEFVIIDDGSTDETPVILQQFAGRDGRIRLLQGHGGGITRSLNLGIAAAKSSLIARMDGDDIALPTRLERQVAYMDGHEDCVAVGTSVAYIDPDGDPLGWHRMPELHTEIVDFFIRNLGFGIAHPAVVFRRDAFVRIGGYDERDLHAEDYGMFLRLSEVGRFSNISEPLLQLRLHDRQVSAQHNAVQRQNAIKIAHSYCARHGLPLPEYGEVPPCAVHLNASAARCSFAARAMRSGQVRTSLKHLRRAVLTSPMSPHVWTTGLRALRDLFSARTNRDERLSSAALTTLAQNAPQGHQKTERCLEKC